MNARRHSLTHAQLSFDGPFRCRVAVPAAVLELQSALVDGQVDAQRHLLDDLELFVPAELLLPDPGSRRSATAHPRGVQLQPAVVRPYRQHTKNTDCSFIVLKFI